MPHRRARTIPFPSPLLVCSNPRRRRTFSLSVLCCTYLPFSARRVLTWAREHFILPPAQLFSWEWDIDTSSPSSSTRSYSCSPWDSSSSMPFTCNGCWTCGRSPTRRAHSSETASYISSCTFNLSCDQCCVRADGVRLGTCSRPFRAMYVLVLSHSLPSVQFSLTFFTIE